MTEAAFSPQAYLENLIPVVERLSAPTTAQMAWLDENGLPIDELMLFLDDLMPGLPLAVAPGAVTKSAQAAVNDVHTFLLAMRSNPELFDDTDALETERTLKTAPEWNRVRELAEIALRELKN